eukprot:gnl/TRDRNA2_/TRDRNA2_179795_c0_seq1.p1 gnl/TRDRNA2_/TRDRNA2_179795_c0~~gnl/TRDRNA2_/TRDRNA2_179795_c0_seq1.p1  ORF type:complete len:201 (+),score=66.34 gnl/TRDRNA2_/TRDRNA2_179795_c0_seq1:81-605(+)
MGSFKLLVLCICTLAAAASEDACIADAHGGCISDASPDAIQGSQLLQVNRVGMAKAAQGSMAEDSEEESDLSLEAYRQKRDQLVDDIETKLGVLTEKISMMEEQKDVAENPELDDVKNSLLQLQDEKEAIISEIYGEGEDEGDEDVEDQDDAEEGDDDNEDVGEPAEPPPITEE